jgi:hypothetical protein
VSEIQWKTSDNRYLIIVDAKWQASIKVSFAGTGSMRFVLDRLVNGTPVTTVHFASCLNGSAAEPVVVVGTTSPFTFYTFFDKSGQHVYGLAPQKLLAAKPACSSMASDYGSVSPSTVPPSGNTDDPNHIKVINQVFDLGSGNTMTVTIHLENASTGGA